MTSISAALLIDSLIVLGEYASIIYLHRIVTTHIFTDHGHIKDDNGRCFLYSSF